MQRTLKRELKGRETAWKETGGAAMQSLKFSLQAGRPFGTDRKTGPWDSHSVGRCIFWG